MSLIDLVPYWALIRLLVASLAVLFVALAYSRWRKAPDGRKVIAALPMLIPAILLTLATIWLAQGASSAWTPKARVSNAPAEHTITDERIKNGATIEIPREEPKAGWEDKKAEFDAKVEAKKKALEESSGN